MKVKLSNIVIIIVFIMTITIPQILSWAIDKNEQNILISENRKLTEKPNFKLETITEYPKRFEEYYNDNLPFREELIKVWSNINYNIFRTSASKLAIIGKDSWLFYRGNDSIEQVQGLTEIKSEDKKNILMNLELNDTKLKEKDIEMHVLVIPNKENVYREYLPDSIPIKNDVSNVENLIKYIQDNSDINIIYPKNELLDQKNKYHQIYRKYDTHWNKIGACIGTIALQRGIKEDFIYNIDNIEIENIKEKDDNDLAIMARLEEKLFETTLKVKNFYTDIEYSVDTNDMLEEFESNSINEETVLFIGDSFSKDMKDYFSKLYKKVIYVHRDNYTKELIEDINPNIVVFETVERYYSSLGMQLVK